MNVPKSMQIMQALREGDALLDERALGGAADPNSADPTQQRQAASKPVHREEVSLVPDPAHTHRVAVRVVRRESRRLRRAQRAQVSSRLCRRGNAQRAAHASPTTRQKNDRWRRRASAPKVASQVHVALRLRSMRRQARAQANRRHGARAPSETLFHKRAITCSRIRDVHRTE